MIRGRLLGSLALNGILFLGVLWRLAGGGSWTTTQPSRDIEDAHSTGKSDPLSQRAQSSFDWSQLDLSTWFTYRDSLLRIGCPHRTVRDIIEPLMNRAFDARAREATAPFRERFWEMVCPPAHDVLAKLEVVLQPLHEEKESLIEGLFAGAPSDDESFPRETKENPDLSFLPSATRRQAAEIVDGFSEKERALERDFSGEPKDHVERLKSLAADRLAALAAILSPDELAQYRLRAAAASRWDRWSSVDLTLDESTALTIAIEKNESNFEAGDANARRTNLWEQIRSALDPTKAAEIERAETADFQRVVRITDRLEAPPAQAVQLWEIEQAAKSRALTLRNSSELTWDDRRQQLEALKQGLSEQVSQILGGTRGQSTWESGEKDWLRQVFSLPIEDPLALPDRP